MYDNPPASSVASTEVPSVVPNTVAMVEPNTVAPAVPLQATPVAPTAIAAVAPTAVPQVRKVGTRETLYQQPAVAQAQTLQPSASIIGKLEDRHPGLTKDQERLASETTEKYDIAGTETPPAQGAPTSTPEVTEEDINPQVAPGEEVPGEPGFTDSAYKMWTEAKNFPKDLPTKVEKAKDFLADPENIAALETLGVHFGQELPFRLWERENRLQPKRKPKATKRQNRLENVA